MSTKFWGHKYETLSLIRFATITRDGLEARIAFKTDSMFYGIYWGGEVEKWIPAKWYCPSGAFSPDKPSALDLSIPKKLFKEIK